MLGNVTLVDTPDEAQVALLMVSPQSGAYFNATPGYLELDICEDKTVCNVMRAASPPPRPTRRPLWWAQTVWPVSLLRSTHTAQGRFQHQLPAGLGGWQCGEGLRCSDRWL